MVGAMLEQWRQGLAQFLFSLAAPVSGFCVSVFVCVCVHVVLREFVGAF
jgi:hypothetical protein